MAPRVVVWGTAAAMTTTVPGSPSGRPGAPAFSSFPPVPIRREPVIHVRAAVGTVRPRMPTTRVRASRVVTPTGIVGPAEVVVDDGRILAIDAVATAPDRTLVPGFVDLQVNGIDDVDVARADGEDWERLDGLLLAQGT